MLIRVGGGRDGVKEYLERGQKAGRELGRDRLDERVILHGNLVRTNQVIQSIDSAGERYLHFTLGFREDNVTPEILAAVLADFKALTFVAFRDDEICFYAEAHLPRVKSVVNHSTGEFVERKPHIHVVIPNKNLLSRRALNPLGKVSHNLLFVDAIQEHINSKYGLASPKDYRRRSGSSSESQIIARYKDSDRFARRVSAKETLRGALLSSIILHDPRTMAELVKLVAEHGIVGVANPGKSNEYLKVKPPGASSWTRLKSREFTREFLDLPLAQKRAALVHLLDHRQGDGPGPTDALTIEDRLLEWRQVRAKEVKYIKSGSTKRYAAFRNADRDAQLTTLARSEAAFYMKWEAYRGQQQKRSRLERTGANLRAAGRHLQAAGRCHASLDRIAEGVSDRAAVRALGAAVQRHQVHQGQPSAIVLCANRRPADHVTGQLQYEACEREQQRKIEARPDTAELNRTIDAARLLATLAGSHGVIVARYRISKGKDGGDRVGIGGRNWKPSDFIAKHLHLPWAEAEPILRDEYARQCAGTAASNVPTEPKRSSLWSGFHAWKIDLVDRRQEAWATQRSSETERRRAAALAFQAIRSKVRADNSLLSSERRTAISLARVQKIRADKALSAAIQFERNLLKSVYLIKSSELFRAYLQQLANGGHVAALIELRRQRVEPESRDIEMAQLVNGREARSGRGSDGFGESHAALTYRVERNGDVTYRLNNHDVLRDEVRAVRFLDSRDANCEAMEVGLRLALQKFGPKLGVNGDDEFKRRIVETAVRERLHVEFTDPDLNRYHQRLEAERASMDSATTGAQHHARKRGPEYVEHVGTPQSADAPQSDLTPELGVIRDRGLALSVQQRKEELGDRNMDEMERDREDESIDVPAM